jgi:predicted nucleic acid-binding protein
MNKTERAPVFVDAGPWIALMDPHDQWRAHALRVMQSLQDTDRSLVTSNLVLMEAYSALAGRVERSAIAKFRATLRSSGAVRMERVDAFLEELAWQLFLRYDDKAIGMVDCTSFAIMEQWQITEAFTFDRHFKQVGFQTLPRLK